MVAVPRPVCPPSSGDSARVGAVRLRPREGGGPPDVVIGRSGWMSGMLERAAESEVDGIHVPVARRADLILLTLYAGGHQDAWDIEQLLAGAETDAVIAEVARCTSRTPSCWPASGASASMPSRKH